jgi:uncharacterized membrane protein YbhN (UPF0104 family)
MEERSPLSHPGGWRWISAGLTAVFVAGGACYVARHASEFVVLRDISLTRTGQITALTLITWVLYAWCNNVVVGIFGIRLRVREWFGLSMVGAMANMVAPFSAGSGLRAVYMKRRYDLPYTHFASCVVAPLLIATLVNSTLGLAALAILGLGGATVSIALAAAVGAAFVSSLGMVLWPFRALPSGGRWVQRLASALRGWHMVVGHRRALLQLAAWMAAATFLLTAVYYLTLDAISVKVPWTVCLVMASCGSIVRLANITPGGLGVYEGVLTLTSSSFAMPASAGMMAALIHRLLSSVIILVTGVVYSHVLSRELAGTPPQPEGEALLPNSPPPL